jgi:hypothetical protein
LSLARAGGLRGARVGVRGGGLVEQAPLYGLDARLEPRPGLQAFEQFGDPAAERASRHVKAAACDVVRGAREQLLEHRPQMRGQQRPVHAGGHVRDVLLSAESYHCLTPPGRREHNRRSAPKWVEYEYGDNVSWTWQVSDSLCIRKTTSTSG